MSFMDDIFEGYFPDLNALAAAGFVREDGDWVRHGEILFGHFDAVLRISPLGQLHLVLCDSNGEEYALIHVDSATGDFVKHVRDACGAWLTEVRAYHLRLSILRKTTCPRYLPFHGSSCVSP